MTVLSRQDLNAIVFIFFHICALRSQIFQQDCGREHRLALQNLAVDVGSGIIRSFHEPVTPWDRHSVAVSTEVLTGSEQVLSEINRCCPFTRIACDPGEAATSVPRMSLSSPAAHATPIPLPAFTVLCAAVEALIGRRPLHAVRRVFAPLAFQAFSGYVDITRSAGLTVRTMAAQMPSPHAVEATVTLTYGGRELACAIRLDHHRRWMCSQLEVIGITRLEQHSVATSGWSETAGCLR